MESRFVDSGVVEETWTNVGTAAADYAEYKGEIRTDLTRGVSICRVYLRCSSLLLLADLSEGKDIPVGIGDLEAPQAVIDERQLFHERRTPLLELVEQRVGVQGVDVGIPASPSVPGVVGTWKHVGKGWS